MRLQEPPFPKRQRVVINPNIVEVPEVKESKSNWYSTIENEASLFNTILKIIKFIMTNDNDNAETPKTIEINSYHIATLNATDVKKPSIVGELVLDCMSNWYSSQPNHKFEYNPSIIQNMLQILRELQMKDENSSTFDIFSHKHRILTQLGSQVTESINIDNRFQSFFEWIYYDPLIPWISKNRLKFVSKIGSGSQANVLKVQDTTNGELFALKLFNKIGYCLHEDNILSAIQQELNNDFADVHVPRIVKGCSISCYANHGILMEFVDKVSHKKLNLSTQSEAVAIWNQLSHTIKILGDKGIGHFDINDGNVLKDKNGKYWLIDWGLAKIIKNDTTPLKLAATSPIYGTWYYYAPDALELSRMMTEIGNKMPEVIYPEQFSRMMQLIVNGNLYSLQALMFRLTKYGRSNTWKIEKLHRELNEEWRFAGSGEITSLMVKILSDLWKIRKDIVDAYVHDKLTQHILQREHVNMLLSYEKL